MVEMLKLSAGEETVAIRLDLDKRVALYREMRGRLFEEYQITANRLRNGIKINVEKQKADVREYRYLSFCILMIQLVLAQGTVYENDLVKAKKVVIDDQEITGPAVDIEWVFKLAYTQIAEYLQEPESLLRSLKVQDQDNII